MVLTCSAAGVIMLQPPLLDAVAALFGESLLLTTCKLQACLVLVTVNRVRGCNYSVLITIRPNHNQQEGC
jgi:hypothetical protein